MPECLSPLNLSTGDETAWQSMCPHFIQQPIRDPGGGRRQELTVVVTSGGLQHRIQAAQASRWKAAD